MKPLVPLALLASAAAAQAPFVRPSLVVDSAHAPAHWEMDLASAGEGTALAYVERDEPCPGSMYCPTGEVFGVFSDGRGLAWSAPVRLDLDPDVPPGDKLTPKVVATPSALYVGWRDGRLDPGLPFGSFEVFLRRSTDGGASFGPEVHVGKGSAPGNPSVLDWFIDVDPDPAGDHVYVAMKVGMPPSHQPVITPSEVIVVASHDGGASFGPAVPISTGPGNINVAEPLVRSRGLEVHVLWRDNRADGLAGGAFDLWYQRSVDGGLTWLAADVQVGDPSSSAPAVFDHDFAMEGSSLVAVWSAAPFASSPVDVRAAGSIDGGASWSADASIAAIPYFATVTEPGVVLVGGEVVAGWRDDRNGSFEPWVARASSPVATFDLPVSPSSPGAPVAGIGPILAAGEDGLVGALWADFAQQTRASTSRDGGRTWSTAFDASDTPNEFAVKLAHNGLYSNFVVAHPASDGLRAGGWRPAAARPMGFTSGGTAHVALDGFSGLDPLAWVLVSGSPGSLPLGFAGDPRELGLHPDVFLLYTLMDPATFTAALTPAGTGATASFPLPLPPGISLSMAAVSFSLAPFGLSEITDVVMADVL